MWWRQAQASREGEEALTTATHRLEKLIPAEKRNTIKMKPLVRIGKPYQSIVQYCGETNNVWLSWACVERVPWMSHLWFNHLSRDPVGALPVLAVHV